MAQFVDWDLAAATAGTLSKAGPKVKYAEAADVAGQLLLVAPHIVDVERKLDADPRDFRLWVCLHEVTHRTQFTAVPWLRGQFFAEVEAFVNAAQADSEQPVQHLTLRRLTAM